MRPMILTNANGEKRRLTPFQIAGWVAADFEHNGRAFAGCAVVLGNGAQVLVRESEEQLDHLFERATGGSAPHGAVSARAAQSAPQED